jgi:hypothetical protein
MTYTTINDQPNTPAEMLGERRWVAWRYEERDGKQTKVPINPETGEYASATDSTTWGTHADAMRRAAKSGLAGVGFVLGDGWVGIDFDNYREKESGYLMAPVPSVVKSFGTYAEVSPSKTGVKIIGRGKLPEGLGNRTGKNEAGQEIEVYDSGRYFTVTGEKLDESPATVGKMPEAFETFCRQFLPERDNPSHLSPDKRLDARGGRSFEDSKSLDDEVISILSRKVPALWSGDTSGHGGDDSKADAALLNHIVYYTGGDEAQADRVFRQSGLYRPKWERADYRRRTFAFAMKGRCPDDFYKKNGHHDMHANGHSHNGTKVSGNRETFEAQDYRPEMPDDYGNGCANANANGYADLFDKIKSVADLEHVEFPEPRWAVPGIVPEGFTLLAGKSKIGKSWMALGIAVAVASGGVAFGNTSVEAGDVLYLALEDNDRRMQDRLRTLLGGRPFPKRLMFTTEWPRLGLGGLEAIDAWLDAHPDARLLIVDVLARVKGNGRSKVGNAYELDYDAVAPLQRVAQERGVSVLVLHHLRKGDSEDPVETISGTLGNVGPADGIMVLSKKRGERTGKLFITGRDIPEDRELALEMNPATAAWVFVGEAAEVELSEDRRKVLGYLKAAGTFATVRDIAAALDKKYEATRQLLVRMVTDGLVERRVAGSTPYYAVPKDPTPNTRKDVGSVGDVGSVDALGTYTPPGGTLALQNGESSLGMPNQANSLHDLHDQHGYTKEACGDADRDVGGYSEEERAKRMAAARRERVDTENHIASVVGDLLADGRTFPDDSTLIKEDARVAHADKGDVKRVVGKLTRMHIIDPKVVYTKETK